MGVFAGASPVVRSRLLTAARLLIAKSREGAIRNLARPAPVVTNRARLQVSIRARMEEQYVTSAQAMIDDLAGKGAPKFALNAAWKRKELVEKARQVAASVANTAKARKRAIDARDDLLPHEKADLWKAFLAQKTKQLENMVNAEAQFTAERDVLIHSGLVKKGAKVWEFKGSPAPCGLCQAITSGNPYTTEQASAIGAKAHPNCRDSWQSDWNLLLGAKDAAKNQVRYGDTKLWTGTSQTPIPGSARALAQELKDARPETWDDVRAKAVELVGKNGGDAELAAIKRTGVRQD